MNEYEWVDTKEKISATIFDFEPEDYINELHEEDCNKLAEIIMERLGFTLKGVQDDA